MEIPKITPGYLAFFVSLTALVPQFYKIIITHDISSFSLIFIGLGILSQILWISQGAFVSNDKAVIINGCVWGTFYSYILYLYISQKVLSPPTKEKKDGNEVGHI